jgi:hypothetical protein
MTPLHFNRPVSQPAARASQWLAPAWAAMTRAFSLSTNESSTGFDAWFFVNTTGHPVMAVVHNQQPRIPTQSHSQFPMSSH